MAEKFDDVLRPFLSLMRKELHANSGKGDRPGWLRMDANTALLEVYWHAAKLSAAVKNNDGPAIMEHGADVANMAMMVLDICGGLAWVDDAAGTALLMARSEAEIDDELQSLGIAPETAAQQGRDAVAGAMSQASQREALHLIASTTTDAAAREEADRALSAKEGRND